MRILLTSHCGPATIGGTQSWNRTVAAELESRGHEVTVLGKEAHTWPFADLAIVSQHTTFERARAVADFVLYVQHGVTDLDEPPEGADAYVYVSEELGTPVIRQPIDTDFWRPGVGFAPPPIDVVRVSYYDGMEWLPEVCAGMGLEFRHVKDEPNPKELREMYNRARVVVASGRSALEAMSCSRPVIIADRRSYNGRQALISTNVEQAMRTNYSGRGGEPLTPDGMLFSLRWGIALGPHSPGLRDHVLRNHEVGAIVDQLLEPLER